jgi:hypothetical protein
MSKQCLWCSAPAFLVINDIAHLCSACWERLEPRVKILNPLASVAKSSPDVNVTVAASNPAPDPETVAVTPNSISDGAWQNSLPSGESEPPVMLASAPSDSRSALASAMMADISATAPHQTDPAVAVAGSFEYPEMPEFLRRSV